ncbi:Lrp/AsnC family transcriptional regulator [Aliikangiella coralliicola]|uniref:Lrp/AsnC family transcriptional regulator n=1 Tax=Aliikangiella coralliicola TaxID=2592383 RepID=A0A545UCN8_9GAMM|nr:Lrp/AsnC family transcriptional regulator [Aliikangiella coralliicola]TQV87242.1 Lrp/AsnC family transcriptional regulator [Aliikangiella coralliicola]
MPQPPLTGLDWKILELLQHDGRITISELAKQLERSRSNITERVERLYDCGVINEISADINTEKLGFGIKAFVRLNASSSHHREIVSAIVEKPEVCECHVLTGAELVLIQVVAKDMPHLRQFVDGLTQYGSTQTDVVFATVKNQIQVNTSLRKLVESNQ